MHPTDKKKLSFGLFLAAIGAVYGDIATSPLFVMKTILRGNVGLAGVSEEFVLGALSLIIWTITILATVKYVLLVMRNDNGGEGGIFAIYSLVKKKGKWLILPAIVGAAMLLADSIITPAITVTAAVEGLSTSGFTAGFFADSPIKQLLVILAVILLLFLFQGVGHSRLTGAFGPIMLLWLLLIGGAGAASLVQTPGILRAFNPVYGIKLISSPCNKAGFVILGSVFLAVTGAEAFYSDMGHVGGRAARLSWPAVKLALILNYLGQGAWLLRVAAPEANGSAGTDYVKLAGITDMNPFFYMLPEELRPVTVLLAVTAAFTVAQAVVTGAFTLASEAMRLDVLPHLETLYPPKHEGQIYIPVVSRLLCVGCCFVVIYFKTSARMEAAYGLAIAMTMLMTTLLLAVYTFTVRKKKAVAVLLGLIFAIPEALFIKASSHKFVLGGYISEGLALVLIVIMLGWYCGTKLERKLGLKLRLRDYIPKLRALRDDDSLPVTADNVVYVGYGEDVEMIDRDILYSILDKDVKRALTYWFISVHVTDEPYAASYKVESFGSDFVFRIKLNLGFKNEQSINLYLRRIVEELIASGDMPPQRRRFSIYDNDKVGDFKFVFLKKKVPMKSGLPNWQDALLRFKYLMREHAGSTAAWYGLDTAVQIRETVPLFISPRRMENLELEREE